MSFKVNPLTDDLIAIKNQTAIARSLRNLVLTAPGERFFNNKVGSRVNQLLFENMDDLTAASIKSEIENICLIKVFINFIICSTQHKHF